MKDNGGTWAWVPAIGIMCAEGWVVTLAYSGSGESFSMGMGRGRGLWMKIPRAKRHASDDTCADSATHGCCTPTAVQWVAAAIVRLAQYPESTINNTKQYIFDPRFCCVHIVVELQRTAYLV